MKIFRLLPILAVLFFVSCSTAQTKTDTSFVKDIDATEFKQQSQDHTIIDVRTPGEVAEGKIKNALHVNFYDDDFMDQINKLKLDKTKEVFVYCRSGGRSGSAAKQLSDIGFTKVYNLSGGMMGWQSNNFEVVK